MDSLTLKNFGPIDDANIEIGDFTLLIGPQASGKSIFLQVLKLLKDKEHIFIMLKEYGYIWDNAAEMLESYFGEGMGGIWKDNTRINFNKEEISKADFLHVKSGNDKTQEVIYIPAQRVLTLQNGWPKPFGDYGNDPFVLKNFGDLIRGFMEVGPGSALFPADAKDVTRDDMYRSVFYDAMLELDKSGHRRRFILNTNGAKLPFMMWSTGQKEFISFWLCVYLLLHPQARNLAKNRIVIIEEPEMGLHPQAIKELIIEMLELIYNGYKVVVSTHSPVFLEFAWAVKILKENHAKSIALHELFDKMPNEKWNKIFDQILKSSQFNTYYFDKNDHGGTVVKDISSLDANSSDVDVSEWGGLSSFATRASEIVAKNIPV